MATKFIRSKVSKEKRRYIDKTEGFDLDLSYITKNIIAMGFPSEDSERFYRNPYSEVIRFLDTNHKDKFKIYNLCSERGYDPAKFYNRVGVYPFDDHNAPVFELIEDLCADVKEFLSQGDDYVAVIHCKAGKGRTGLMICCWLLYNREWPDAVSAQSFYAAARTYNQKGVTIPSQIRYVNYFAERMKLDKWEPNYKEMKIKSIVLNGVPKIGGDELKLTIYLDKKPFNPWKEHDKDILKKSKKGGSKGQLPTVTLDCGGFPVIRDVKVQLDEKKLTSQEVLFTFWFNTYFVKHHHLHLEQSELDKANKDRQHRIYPPGFSVDVFFECEPGEEEKEREEEKAEHAVASSSSSSSAQKEEEEVVVDIPSNKADALNSRGGVWAKPARHAVELSTSLLDQAIELYRFALPPKQTHVTARFAPKRVGEKEKEKVQSLEVATGELQKVSLDDLSQDELCVFWLNTVNLMYLHAFVVYGPSNSTTTREKMLEKACYNIGGHIYPLVFVEQVMLCGNFNKSAPSDLSGLKVPKAKIKEKDPRKAYMLHSPSNLIHFAIAGGARCLPNLFVFHSPQSLLDDLKSLAKMALADIVIRPGKIHLPIYVLWYRKNFGKKEDDVVQYLLEVAGEKTEGYSSVVYSEPDWEFGYFFLHFIRGVSLEEGWREYRELEEEKEKEEKEAKKADLMAIMDEIDEMESDEGSDDKGKGKEKEEATPKPKIARNDSVPPSPGDAQKKRKEKEKKDDRKKSGTIVDKKSRSQLRFTGIVGEGEAMEGHCELCSSDSIVYCKSCDVSLCRRHLEAEHTSVILRKHTLFPAPSARELFTNRILPSQSFIIQATTSSSPLSASHGHAMSAIPPPLPSPHGLSSAGVSSPNLLNGPPLHVAPTLTLEAPSGGGQQHFAPGHVPEGKGPLIVPGDKE